jgi:hypothetical protein
MNILGSVNAVVVPRWVRAAVVVLLGALIIAYGVSVVLGILDEQRSGWLEASAYLLGVLVPILIIVLVAGFSEGGVSALSFRTQEFLLRILPGSLPGLEEPDTQFVTLNSRSLKRRKAKKIVAKVQHAPGTCIANYRVIFTPDGSSVRKEILFRVELNARKVNFNLIFDTEAVGHELNVSPMETFTHSIEGAGHEGYWFNNELISRTIEGQHVRCIVGSKKLEDTFLLNPVAKLDLAQDLVLMLRSFVNEAPDLFATKSNKSRRFLA